MNINFNVVKECVKKFKGKSARVDAMLTDSEILRMSHTASRIPAAQHQEAVLVDVGGTIFWLPIYMDLLGYKQIIILSRPNATFAHMYTRQELGLKEGFSFELLDCDADLCTYPIEDNLASCVVSFETLEHFAGDPMNLISESNRILIDNGDLCLTTPNVIASSRLVALAFGMHPFGWSAFTDSFADRHNREYTPFEVIQLLKTGGFKVSHMETFSISRSKALIRFLGAIFSMPAFISRKVPFSMRNQSILVRGKKSGPVTDRYPAFLYHMYGGSRVRFKIPHDYL